MKFLDDKREYIEKLLNWTNLGILVLDIVDERLVFSNSYYQKISGSFSDKILAHIFKSIHSNRGIHVQNTIKLEEDSVFDYMIGSISENSDNFVIIISDVSLEKINMEIVEYDKYYKKLSKFASEITHEAGNPLTSIIMTLQVLLSNMEIWGKDKCKEYLLTSIHELRRLSEFIKRIRNISIEQPIRMETIDIQSFISDFSEYCIEDVLKKSLSLKTKCEKGINVQVDVDKLNRIFKNLINNSIHILPEKTGEIIIRVEEVNEFYVKIIYENNGPALSQKELDTIFIPSISEKARTDSLGLDISLKLMIRMDGLIKVENKADGKGVKFIIFVRKA